MKGTMGILVTTTLDRPVEVFVGIEGLTTLVVRDIKIDEVNFSDTIGAVGMFDNGTLTCRGDTPPDDMAKVGV